MCSLLVLLLLGLTSTPFAQQVGDSDWEPRVDDPKFEMGQGPRVLVDAAHNNFHTIEGRFGAFAELLTKDGYRVESATETAHAELFSGVDIFVVANALGAHDSTWALPTPKAFTKQEIDAIVAWVRQGGSLWLIADHMPFPGAVEDLALALGIVFHNGFAMSDRQNGTALFDRDSKTLVDHVITRGQHASESVPYVRSFTGQAFRTIAPVEPLLAVPDDWRVLLPEKAWDFKPETPYISAKGLLQGAVFKHGKGRVAVFGEAAMFTAQSTTRGDVVYRVGMNHPEAPHNAQFVLNVAHWLSPTTQP